MSFSRRTYRPGPRARERGHSECPVRDTSAASAPCSPLLHPTWGSQSRGAPRESLDALENLTKEVPRQVAFGELQGEVPSMPDEASARPEQPLLEAREGPVLRQNLGRRASR